MLPGKCQGEVQAAFTGGGFLAWHQLSEFPLPQVLSLKAQDPAFVSTERTGPTLFGHTPGI